MKLIQKIIFITATAVGFVLVSIILYIDSFSPQYSGKEKVSDIRNEIEIYFDHYGVPHVYTQSDYDLFFSLGYIHAMERLFQMEMIRRLSSGRISEILGKDFIETDKFFRLIGIHEKARINAEKLKNKRHTAYFQSAQAYLNGINAYIKKGIKPIEYRLLGMDPEPFSIEDIYLTVGYLAFNFATGFISDPILTEIHDQLGEEYVKDLAISYIPGTLRIPVHKPTNTDDAQHLVSLIIGINKQHLLPEWSGSNSWVLGAKRTESGAVILCNDPHIQFSQPAVWYESHLECPKFMIYGYHVPGIPFPLIGRTEHSAWGLTMFMNDDVDFYREKMNLSNPGQYADKDIYKNFKIRHETIKVKDEADIHFTIRETRHGPIITDLIDTLQIEGNDPVAVWWAYYQLENNELESLYNLLKSTHIDQTRYAVSRIYAPGLNFMYGDKDGNIAWWAAGRLPIRPSHVNPFLFLDGASGNDDYLGFYDFQINPQSENPPEGFVYSANNQPDSIAGILYPGYYAPGNRAARINHLLEQKEKWSPEELKDIMLDDISKDHVETVRNLIQIIKSVPVDSDLKEAVEILQSWDGSHSGLYTAPTIYYKWLYYILEMTFGDEIGMDRVLALYNYTFIFKRVLPKLIRNEKLVWWDNINTPEIVENRAGILYSALQQSIHKLSQDWGNELSKWTWENVHVLEHVHPIGMRKPFDFIFNAGPYEVDGGNEVINNQSFTLSDEKILKVILGPSVRRIENFEVPGKSYTILPTGQSGHFMSPYYDDQAILYNKGLFRELLLEKDKIIENSDEILILYPKK